MYKLNLTFAILAIVIANILPFSDAYIPRILNGRPRGGFLGIPDTHGGLQSVRYQEAQWFEQKLDQFDPADTRTWRQKYYVNDSFYKEGGPVFVWIGGEGPANPIWLTNGAWIEYAKMFHAYGVMVEHRFYGDSHPTIDLSTENLKYLSSEQALADLAAIVSYFKTKMNGAKVIMFGGSYSGALSAWFRLKYPHLADGAIASSAPVLAQVDFKEYLEVVDNDLANSRQGGQCNSNINLATAYMVTLLKSKEGRDSLKKKFNLCSDIDPTNQEDIENLFNTLAGNVMEVVQYNKDNRAFEGGKAHMTIETICDTMTDTSLTTPLDRYAAVNSMFMKNHDIKCVDFQYAAFIKDMRATAWNSSAAEGSRQWIYQTCVEFGFYQTTDSFRQPFGHYFPLKFSLKQCSDIYGPKFTDAVVANGVKNTNIYYGGRDPKVTKVVFPNGSVDPWHALSVLKDLNKDARAIFINGTAHCANMYPSASTDLPELTQARKQISKSIADWLSE